MSCHETAFDVVVVGAGIEGSSAAYQCVKAGKKVLLLEQFALPHTRGSSHGGQRCTIYATPQPHHRPMMKEAYALWDELEKETNAVIKREVGLFVVVEPEESSKGFAGVVLGVMDESGFSLEKLTTEERTRRFPAFVPTSTQFDSYYYSKAGYILANKALSSFQSEFIKRGGVLRDAEKMLEIVPGAIATVKTSRGEYRAKSVILTPGPWAAKVLQPLGLEVPLEVKRVHHIFWREKTEGTYRDFPIFEQISSAGFLAYGIPSVEYQGLMKLAVWSPSTIPDPDQRDAAADSSEEVELSRQYVRENFPGLDADNGPAIMETCMVTATPDMDFIIDVHPDHPNLVFGCGFVGGGFELSPIVGKILCQLAIGETPQHEIEPMRLKRFQKELP